MKSLFELGRGPFYYHYYKTLEKNSACLILFSGPSLRLSKGIKTSIILKVPDWSSDFFSWQGHTHRHIYTYACTRTHMHVHAHIHTYMHTQTYACLYAYMLSLSHTHTHPNNHSCLLKRERDCPCHLDCSQRGTQSGKMKTAHPLPRSRQRNLCAAQVLAASSSLTSCLELFRLIHYVSHIDTIKSLTFPSREQQRDSSTPLFLPPRAESRLVELLQRGMVCKEAAGWRHSLLWQLEPYCPVKLFSHISTSPRCFQGGGGGGGCYRSNEQFKFSLGVCVKSLRHFKAADTRLSGSDDLLIFLKFCGRFILWWVCV